jgi:hypothetical protein
MAIRFPVSTPNFRNSISKPPFRASPISKSSWTRPEAHDVVHTIVKKDDSQKAVFKMASFVKSTFQGAIEDEAKDHCRNIMFGQNHAEEQPPSSWSRPPPSPGDLRQPEKTTALL